MLKCRLAIQLMFGNNPGNWTIMKEPDFSKMSPEEQDAYRAKEQQETDFREWCAQTEHDPEDEASRETFNEIQNEYGPSYWDDLDPNDREGQEHNIIKSFDE